MVTPSCIISSPVRRRAPLPPHPIHGVIAGLAGPLRMPPYVYILMKTCNLIAIFLLTTVFLQGLPPPAPGKWPHRWLSESGSVTAAPSAKKVVHKRISGDIFHRASRQRHSYLYSWIGLCRKAPAEASAAGRSSHRCRRYSSRSP